MDNNKQKIIDKMTEASSKGELAEASRLYYTSTVTWKEFQTALRKGLEINLSKYKEGPPCLR